MSTTGTRNAYLPNYGVAVKVPVGWTDDQIDTYVHQNRAGISAISPVAQRNLANINAQLPANQRAGIDTTGSVQFRHQATIGAAPQQSLGDQALGALSSAGEALFSPIAKLGQMIKQGALATGLATPQAETAYHKQMSATGPYQGAAAQDLAFSQLPQNFYEAVAPQQYHRATNLPYGAGGAVKFLSNIATPENIILGGVTGLSSAAGVIPGAVHTAMAGAFGVPLAAQGVGTLYQAETNPNPNLNDFVEGTLGTALGVGGLAHMTEGLTGRSIGFPVRPTPATPAATTDATTNGPTPTSADLGGVPLDYHAFQQKMLEAGGQPTVQAPPADVPPPIAPPEEPLLTRAQWLAQMEQGARPDPNFTEPTAPVQPAAQAEPAPVATAKAAYPQSLNDAMTARMAAGGVVPSGTADPAFYEQHIPGYDKFNPEHRAAVAEAYTDALNTVHPSIPADPADIAHTAEELQASVKQAGNKTIIDGDVVKPTPEEIHEAANEFHAANPGATGIAEPANAEPVAAEGIATSGAANPQSAGSDFLTEANRILEQHGLQSVTPAEAAAIGSAEGGTSAGRSAPGELVAAGTQPTSAAAENGAGADIRTADLGSAEAAAIRAGAGQATAATGEPGNAVSGGPGGAKSSTVPLKISAAESIELAAQHPMAEKLMDQLFEKGQKSVTINATREQVDMLKQLAMRTKTNDVYNKNSFYKRLQLASGALDKIDPEKVALNSGMNPMDILNDPRTKEAIDKVKGFFVGDKPALTRESETTMAAVTQHEHSATTSQLEYNKHVAPIFKDFTRDEIQQFGAYATADRMLAEGNRMDGVVSKAQSDLVKAQVDQKAAAVQFSKVSGSGVPDDIIEANDGLKTATTKVSTLQKALDAATEQRQNIALGRQADPHSWTDEQGNVHPVSPADIAPFFQQPKMAAALDAYKNTVQPILERNQMQAGGSITGIKGEHTGAFFPTQAVDDAGNSIGLSKMGGGGADSGGRSGPLAQLAVNNHDLAFAGTGKAYNNDFPQVLNDTMRKTLDVATERTMHQTAIKEGILADVNDATQVRRNADGQLEFNRNNRWEPATSLKLQGRYKFQNTGVTDPTLPTHVAMPSRIYKEVAPIWERNSYHSELDDFSNKWWGRYMSTYLGHTLGDFVNHGGALSSRMAHAASRTLPGENSLDAARNVAAVIKSSERFVRYFNPDAFTPDQRFEAMHFATRSGVVPAEYPVSTPSDAGAYSKATGWTKEKLYGEKGILTNAITDVYHQFKSRGALNTEEGQAVLRDALRDLNTTGKTDQSTMAKITKTLGGGTFYQTGVKNRLAAINAGPVQYAAGLVGRTMAITTLVKSMDDKHRWPWEIPGYKWGDIPTGAHDTNGRPIYASMNLLDRAGMYADGITPVKAAVQGMASGKSVGHTEADYGVNLLNNAIAPAVSGPLPAIGSGITGMTPTLSLNRNLTGLEAIPNRSIYSGKIVDMDSWPSRLSGALPMLGAMNDLGQTPGTNDVHGPARYINTAGRFFGLPQLHTGANEAIVRKNVQRQEAPVHAR